MCVIQIPSRVHISNRLLPELVGKLKVVVANELSAAECVCLTCDGWSSPTQEHYCALTAHFIGNDFKLKSVVVGVVVIEDKTAEGHEEIISSLLSEYNLNGRITGITTDGAAVMPATARLLKYKWFWCVAHLINLVVQDGLNVGSLSELLLGVRKIVKYFRKSDKTMLVLRRYQREMQLPEHQLILDVKTRQIYLYIFD